MGLSLIQGEATLHLPQVDGLYFLTHTARPDHGHPGCLLVDLAPFFLYNHRMELACFLLGRTASADDLLSTKITGCQLSIDRQLHAELLLQYITRKFGFVPCCAQIKANLSPELQLELTCQDDFIKDIFKKVPQPS